MRETPENPGELRELNKRMTKESNPERPSKQTQTTKEASTVGKELNKQANPTENYYLCGRKATRRDSSNKK